MHDAQQTEWWTLINRTSKQNVITFSLHEIENANVSKESINSMKQSKLLPSNSVKEKGDKTENWEKSEKNNHVRDLDIIELSHETEMK